MRQLRLAKLCGIFAAGLLLAVSMSSGFVHAASTVDITYDLSDTTLVWEARFGPGLVFPVANEDPFSMNGTIAGSMKIRYTSDSSSGMPVVHGAGTLVSFNLTAKSLALPGVNVYQGSVDTNNPAYMTGTLRWSLTAPVSGGFTSGSGFTGLSGNLLMTGTVDCLYPTTEGCLYLVGLPAHPVYPSYSRSGAFIMAGSDGPYGGAQSTRHTLSGRVTAIRWIPGNPLLGLGFRHDGYTAVQLVGREVLREAVGHDPKIIPEPGTLLLLGAGTAGLALVGSATRRSRQR